VNVVLQRRTTTCLSTQLFADGPVAPWCCPVAAAAMPHPFAVFHRATDGAHYNLFSVTTDDHKSPPVRATHGTEESIQERHLWQRFISLNQFTQGSENRPHKWVLYKSEASYKLDVRLSA
jgi:hypothetical protein